MTTEALEKARHPERALAEAVEAGKVTMTSIGHVGRAEPPGPAELVRLCVILVRLGGFAVPGDSRDADITNDRLGLLGDAEVARLLAELEEPTS